MRRRQANELYRKLGLDVQESKIYGQPEGPLKLSRFHEGKTLGELRYSDPAAYEAACKKLREGFVADALLGNWDVIGANADNVLVTTSGQVLRIDNGGSLRYRAQGGLQSRAHSGPERMQANSDRSDRRRPTRTPPPYSARLPRRRSAARSRRSSARKASLLKAAPADVRDVLKQRIDYLKEYGKTAGKPAKPIKVGNWKATPAANFKDLSPDLKAWGEQHYKDWRDNLSPNEKNAVENYTGSGYRRLNKYLRGDTTETPPNLSIIPELDKALNAKPVPEDIVVYRSAEMGGMYHKMGINGRGRSPARDGPG